jgi:N-acylglucosamine-6-phosphate 2-epimerase
MDTPGVLRNLQNGLVVSCQAGRGELFFGPLFMLEFARCAQAGGAAGIRANGPQDVRAIANAMPLPLIGLYKIDSPGCPVRITPTLAAAIQIAAAGARIIALDATRREHPGGLSAQDLIRLVSEKTGLPVLADVSTLEEGLAARDAGAAAVSTTLSGYTDYSTQQQGPDFELVEILARRLGIPVLAEGRIASGLQARRMFELGAYAVVVGSAITRPQWIVEHMLAEMQA